MARTAWVTGVFVLSLLILASPSPGQIITGEIVGAVTDQAGAAVPNATVTAECPATKASRTVTTNEAGGYRLSSLPVCSYQLTVFAQGFKTEVRKAYVEVGITLKADFQLQVGQKTETVTVEAAAPLVDYSPGVNSEVDQQRIVDLPFNGRDFKSILAITPGVQRAPGGGFLDVSINGMRTTSNNYQIDGIPNNDRFYGSEMVGQPGVLGVSASVLSNDVISDFTVEQMPSAEYGTKGGAVINVTLKSGTNDFHGSAYEFYHEDFTDADNPITHSPVSLHNNNYGGTLGGPIVKDRTFFFANFEGQQNRSVVPYPVDIPTQGDINQAISDFKCVSVATCPAGSPIVNVGGLPMNTAGQALLKYYPISPSLTPGGTTQNVSLPNTDTMSSFIIKIDHKVNNKVQLSGRYLFADSFQSAPSAGFEIQPPASSGLSGDAFNTIAPTRVQLASAQLTYNIAPNKIFETRFSWSRYSQILDLNNKVNPAKLGIDTGPLNPLDFGVPVVYSSLVGSIGGIPGYPLSTRPTQVYDYSAHTTWIHGAHTFKFGGNYQYGSTYSLRNRAHNTFGIYETSWEDILDELLLGRVDYTSRSFGDTSRHLYQPSMGIFFQDEWKIRPRITLSYGLRWDVNGALGDENKDASNFYPCAAPEPSNCPPGNNPAGLVPIGPTNPRLYNLDLRDFGPRAGLAWDVFGDGKTALRASYAMTYDIANFAAISAPYPFNGARAGAFTNPTSGVFSVTGKGGDNPGTNLNTLFEPLAMNTCYNPAVNVLAPGQTPDWVCFGPQPGPANLGGSTTVPFQTYGANPTGTPPFNIFGTVPTLRTPRIQYYSLTLQHEVFKNSVLSVAYVGSHGTDLFSVRSLNNLPIGCYTAAGGQQTGAPHSANNTTGLDCVHPFDSVFTTNVNGTFVPSYSYVMQLTNNGWSDYNSLQVTFRQRNWHGINTQYSYTLGNCIDVTSVNRGGGIGYGVQIPLALNPYNVDTNKGPCDTDIRHNFNMGGTYTFPTWSALGRFGTGWETGIVFTAETGAPWTPVLSLANDNTGQDNADQRPDCNGTAHYDFNNTNEFITNAATLFSVPAPGTLGTCGRNSLRVRGLQQLDFNITKLTKITEHVSVQFRFEVYNLLNHANFSFFPASSTLPVSCGGAPVTAANCTIGTIGLAGNGFAGLSTTPDVLNPGVAQGSPRAMQFALKLIF